MNTTKIITFDYLKNNRIAHVRVSDEFRQKIKKNIEKKYNTISRFNKKKIKINYRYLQRQINEYKYFKFDLILKIIADLSISEDELYNNILTFYAKGSNTAKELIINKELSIDPFFVEGFALYLAEGDNGSNGNTKPRKLRLTNSDLNVHKLFIEWIRKYFPNNAFYLRILVPLPKVLSSEHKEEVKQFLNLNESQISIQNCKWKRKTDWVYRTCLDSALLIDFILSIEEKIKELCLEDNELARAYILGMMIGEGTAYFGKSRYVRIEMRNEKEIKYLHKLFCNLDFDCKPSLRTERDNMWSLYIGAKQLKKYSEDIGFGIHEKRQRILEQGANKVLRVNQYC